MSFLDTYTPPSKWSKTNKSILTWMKKNYTPRKRSTITCEKELLAHVFNYICDENKVKKHTLDYRELAELQLNGDYNAMYNVINGLLELDRDKACHYTNAVLAANNTSLAEIWHKSI
jgi:hypothetical protein